MATGVYKKSKKHRENLSKALKKYWSDTTKHDEWTNKIQEGINDYWENKPDDEFVLGRRIRQKIDGKRDKEGYREYQRFLSEEISSENTLGYYAYLRQKKEGKTDLSYEDWYKTYEPYKRINKEKTNG